MCLEQDKITRADFIKFIHSVRNHLFDNADKYDAFLLAFSGHGSQSGVYLSDGKQFGRVKLYKWFNGDNCIEFNDKPRVLLIDACKGNQKAKDLNVVSKDMEELSVAPDDNTVVFNSTTDEYVSWENGKGGAMMQSFIKVMKQKDTMPLHKISQKMSKEMKRVGKKMGTAQTLDFQQKGIDKDIYFCK